MDDWPSLMDECHSRTENTVNCSDVWASREALSHPVMHPSEWKITGYIVDRRIVLEQRRLETATWTNYDVRSRIKRMHRKGRDHRDEKHQPHIYIHIYLYKWSEQNENARRALFLRLRAHECIHACTHSWMHACMKMQAFTCFHTWMHAFMHAFMHACMRACMNVHACLQACMHTCMQVHVWNSRKVNRVSSIVPVFIP